ncbi:hypothetical protein R6Z07F_010000 [Ovis aries]
MGSQALEMPAHGVSMLLKHDARAIHLLLRKCTDMGTENLHFIPGLLAPSMEDSCGLMKLDTEARFQ